MTVTQNGTAVVAVKVLQSVCIRTFFFLCVVFEGTMNSLSASAPPPSPDTLLGV